MNVHTMIVANDGPTRGSTTLAMRRRRYTQLGLLLILAIAEPCAIATTSTPASGFELSGSGSLTLNAPAQTAGNFQIRATLEETNAISGAPNMRQEGIHFSLAATLASAAVACYNDTIFRDDFDGDGL